MRTDEVLVSLPPVRKKVFRHSLLIVGLYVIVGVFMMVAVFVAGRTTPNAIHLNYDSIAAASQMRQAWIALKDPLGHPQKTSVAWSEQFERAIQFEERNITEPGEGPVAQSIRLLWNQFKAAQGVPSQTDFEKMEGYLDQVVVQNEKGMFGWAIRSQRFSQQVFLATVVLFILTLLIALYLADGLAVRIATPLRELAAALKRKPDPGSKLKLPQPTTLEMRILSHELMDLWQRISELQKLNLEEISLQRTQLEAVLSSVDDAIVVIDNRGKVVHCNEGMLRLLRCESKEVMGQPWRDLSLMEPNYLNLKDLLTPEITGDRPVELEVKSKTRVFSGRCREILDKRKEQIGYLYLLHDITEIRQKDRLKTEFIGVLSHELKTPLQSLGTASELLHARRALFDEETRMLVETVYEDAGRIRGVANEFVQVGLIDLHSLRLRIEAVPINELLVKWIQPFQVLARDRNVKIDFIKEGSDTITARIDTVKFPWAITNLLSNAVRVSPPDSSITIRISDREQKVDIEVQDEGPGVSEIVRKRMFDPFYQGEQNSDDKAYGFLGLGLTITKEVVEAHDGEIEYFPRVPTGSIFRIRLPLVMS